MPNKNLYHRSPPHTAVPGEDLAIEAVSLVLGAYVKPSYSFGVAPNEAAAQTIYVNGFTERIRRQQRSNAGLAGGCIRIYHPTVAHPRRLSSARRSTDRRFIGIKEEAGGDIGSARA